MTDRETLLAACLDQPADDVSRSVYADWLRDNDSPVGRFLWAGVTLSRFRGQVVEDGMFFDAQKELNAVAPQVIGTQLKALFGWEWGDVLWDQDGDAADRLTAVHMPAKAKDGSPRPSRTRNLPNVKKRFPAAIYERGMLCGLRIPMSPWRYYAERVLRCCPLDRVEILDVRGLTLRVMGPDACHPGDGWRMSAELKLHAIPARAVFYQASPPHTEPALPAANYYRVNPDGSLPHGYSREMLVERAAIITDMLAIDLETSAGDRWPGPQEEAVEQLHAEDLYEAYGGPIDSEDM